MLCFVPLVFCVCGTGDVCVCLHVTTVVFAGVPCGEWDLCASLVYGIVVGISAPCHICHWCADYGSVIGSIYIVV